MHFGSGFFPNLTSPQSFIERSKMNLAPLEKKFNIATFLGSHRSLATPLCNLYARHRSFCLLVVSLCCSLEGLLLQYSSSSVVMAWNAAVAACIHTKMHRLSGWKASYFNHCLWLHVALLHKVYYDEKHMLYYIRALAWYKYNFLKFRGLCSTTHCNTL